MIANIHKCEQCELHTKKLCIECRNSFSVSQMTADRETGWLFCAVCWAKKPAPKPDPIFAHHSVVRERPAQESSATTATKDADPRRAALPDNPHCSLCGALCNKATDYLSAEWGKMVHRGLCPKYHPNPAPPEAKPCDDGKEEITPQRLPCIVCGVPLCDKTPGAQEWRFTSRETGQEKRGLCHEACIATMEAILKKEATK
jgi:hypothetical protein